MTNIPIVFFLIQFAFYHYYNFKSILVAGVRVNVKDSYFAFDKDGVGCSGTKISTVQNFTAVYNSICKPLMRAFVKAASNMKIKSAAAGHVVPEIGLVLAGKDVTWRMRGWNMMVEIDRKMTCLGLVDRGSSPQTAIMTGSHRLGEENQLKFDLFRRSFALLNLCCS